MTKKILVIDDEPSICEMLQDILTENGYYVEYALNGIKGLELINRINPDVILVDIWMPELNGINLLGLINQHQYKVSTILMSANASSQIIDKGMQMGAYSFLKKPLKIDLLLETIEKALMPISDFTILIENVCPPGFNNYPKEN